MIYFINFIEYIFQFITWNGFHDNFLQFFDTWESLNETKQQFQQIKSTITHNNNLNHIKQNIMTLSSNYNHGNANKIGNSKRIFFTKQFQAIHKLSCIIRSRIHRLNDGNIANENNFQTIKNNSNKTWNWHHNIKYDRFILIN